MEVKGSILGLVCILAILSGLSIGLTTGMVVFNPLNNNSTNTNEDNNMVGVNQSENLDFENTSLNNNSNFNKKDYKKNNKLNTTQHNIGNNTKNIEKEQKKKNNSEKATKNPKPIKNKETNNE